MNVFSRIRNSLWPSPLCCYQMNGIDIHLGYMNLRGILGGKRTIHYESILDILISMFSGVNKCLQGRNIFVIDFSSSRYQIFIISLNRISAEFPAYTVQAPLQVPNVARGFHWKTIRSAHKIISFSSLWRKAAFTSIWWISRL